MRAWLVVLVLLLVPSVAAHGAPEPREVDTRLLADSTQLDYGGPEGAAAGGGLDLLALDVFEGTLPGTATPALVFRAIVQGGEAGDHRIDVHATAGGAEVTLEWTTDDLGTYSSSSFEAVRGPYDVGDGHPKAIEGFVSLAALGISAGDAVTGIRLESHLDGSPQDAMPGGWYIQGQSVPVVPPEEEGDPATYTPQGPLALFRVEPDADVVPAVGQTRMRLNFTSGLETLDQELELVVRAPPGLNASLGSDVVPLAAGGTASTTLVVSGAAVGSLQVLVESDLGSAVLLTFPLQGEGDEGTGADVDSGDLATGAAYQYTFTAPGTFEYHCHPHPFMLGTLTIEEAVNGTEPRLHVVRIVEGSSTDAWGFAPADLTIRAGDTVLWVNEGQEVHTIMGSTGGHGHHGDHGHHDHGDEDDGKDTPMPLLLVPLGIALWAARRHH